MRSTYWGCCSEAAAAVRREERVPEVRCGPAGHTSWCRSSLSWARSLEKHLAVFTPQQEGQEPWNGLWKSVLKRRPPAAITTDSCGAGAQEGVELEGWLDTPRGSIASGVTVIAGGLWQGAWFSRNTRKDGWRWDWGSWFPCPWPGKREKSGIKRRALSRKFSGLILMPF